MYGDAPISPLSGVPGWLTNAEEATMYEIAQKFPEGSFVEIGSEWGRSSAIWAKATHPEAKIFAIDIRFDDDLGRFYKANLDEAGLDGRVTQVAGDSKELAQSTKFRNRKFDLIFVDGDHSEEGAYQDIVNWSVKLRKGGYLLIHDCAVPTNKHPHYTHYDVMNAVSRWQKEVVDFELVKTVDSLMVFKRT